MTIYKGTELLSSSAPTATTNQVGLVKPDGTTITITNDGTISSSASGGVTDVKVNGTTIVTEGVANIPVATSNTLGLLNPTYHGYPFCDVGANGCMKAPAYTPFNLRKNAWYENIAICFKGLDDAVKAAMCDGIGTAWNSTEQTAALTRMGAQQATQTQTITDASTITLADNTIYNSDTALTSLTLAAPSSFTTAFNAQIQFSSGATATTWSSAATITFVGDACSGGVFTPIANKRYTIVVIASSTTTLTGYVMES